MRSSSKIKLIKAREVLDSRGNPTVEVDVLTDLGVFRAQAPAGASKGKYEAVELRDGEKRYHGKGTLKAIKNINQLIAPKLIGKDPTKQKEIDKLLIDLDGTEKKEKLGANAICPVSIAVCRAGAAAQGRPVWQYIANTFFPIGKIALQLPKPSFNIINGGVHAGNELDFQEFMILPQFKKFSENLQAGAEIYQVLKEILEKNFGKAATNLGDEGGFAPPIRFPEEALELIQSAVKIGGYKNKTKYIIDVAASQFYLDGRYQTHKKKMTFTKEGFLNYYQNLIEKYPIAALEDPFAQEDWEGWKMLKSKIKNQKSKIILIGDDLLVTNPKRIKMAKEKEACNGLLLKVNQIGTISEAIEATKLAKSYDWKIMVSHRSGETCDDFIADLAVGIGADYIKAGAPARGERVAKYNRLLRIEEEINQ